MYGRRKVPLPGWEEFPLNAQLVVSMAGAIALFLYGMSTMTEGLAQLSSGRLERVLEKLTDNVFKGILMGALVTAIIHSSATTTVMCVGFVNAGIMKLEQTVGIIMGANIGTTITAQVAALSSFPITTYIQVLTGVGILTTMLCKKERTRQVGFILAGLGLIFVGLSVMSDAMKGNRDAIQLLFENVTNPFLLFLIGIVLTALVQSSSATTSVIIAMSVAGLSIGTGGNEMLFIILGTNIGSCVTALMSSMGSGTNARRTGLIHLMFNTFGSAIFMAVLLAWPGFMAATFARWFAAPAIQIAMFHTFFNVVCTVLFLPFSEGFVKLSQVLVRERKEKVSFTYLDERMLVTPAIAVAQLKRETVVLADMAMDAFETAYQGLRERDKGRTEEVNRLIAATQEKSEHILDYLIKASSSNAGQRVEKDISTIHNDLGDLLRVAEIAENLTKYTRRLSDHNQDFTDEAKAGIEEMVEKLRELFGYTRTYLLTDDADLLPKVDAAEDQVDAMRKALINQHIDRLNAGACKPDVSGTFINLVSNLERLGDHITYVANRGE